MIGSYVIVYTDHSTLKHFLSKKYTKPRVVRWIVLLQEFHYNIRDKKGSENLITNHLCGIVYDREFESHISRCLPNE